MSERIHGKDCDCAKCRPELWFGEPTVVMQRCTYCGSTTHTSETHYDKIKDDSTMNALKYHVGNSPNWSEVIDKMNDEIVAEIGRQFAVKDKEIERLEKLLAHVCDMMQTTPDPFHIPRHGDPRKLIAAASPEIRDWWGSFRSKQNKSDDSIANKWNY